MALSRTEKAASGNFGAAPKWYKHAPLANKPAEPDQAIASSTVTITIASPGVVTWTAHGLAAGRPIVLSTSGALPTGLAAGTTYYVANPSTDTFELAATVGGASINTSGSQSGTHTAKHIMNVSEQAQFDQWKAIRAGGGAILPTGYPTLDYAKQIQARIEAYFSDPAVIAWSHQDTIWRDAQWRLDLVDALETANTNATVSISRDPTGAGQNTSASISGVIAGGGGAPTSPSISPCTSAGDWENTANTSTVAAPTAQAITVPSSPSANSGKLKLAIGINTGTMKYSINGGAWTTFTANTIITVTNGQTLDFEMTGTSAGSIMSGSVYDVDTGILVGSVDLEHDIP